MTAVQDDEPSLLIVNADDYGLTEGISTGILEAHRRGVVTSTSVIALGARSRTVPWLRDEDIDVGIHLTAVGEDPPLLSASEIPTLLDRRGRLPRTYRAHLQRWLTGRIDPADLSREFDAQIAAVVGVGVPITHVDSHQWIHLWPPVAEIVVAAAKRHGIAAVRVPRSSQIHPIALGVRVLADRLADEVTEAGLNRCEDAAGLDQAGNWTARHLTRALDGFRSRGARTADLGVHPGTIDDPDRDRYAWGYHWAAELDLLTSDAAARAIHEAGFRLGTYADLGFISRVVPGTAEAPGRALRG